MVAIAALLNKILTQISRVGGTGTGGGKGGKNATNERKSDPKARKYGVCGRNGKVQGQ